VRIVADGLDAPTLFAQGAALYGRHPGLVAGRIATLAYGVRTGRPYRPGMPGEKRVSAWTRTLV
jgi:hypothetical protein